MDYRLFLPKDEDDLNLLSGELCDKPTFQEVTTKSPGYKKVSLLPVFAVPGLGLPALTPLLEQLIHPAFCCSLPVSTKYLEKYTEDLLEVCLSSYTVVSWLPGKNTGSLLQSVLKIQPQGPYNILGESWGGTAALILGSLLEAREHKVHLFLLNTAPSVCQDRIKALISVHGPDVEVGLKSVLLDAFEESDSDEEIILYVKEQSTSNKGENTSSNGAIRALAHMIKAISKYNTERITFEGELTLIAQQPLSAVNMDSLCQMCERTPKFLTRKETSHYEMLSSPSTAAVINENLAYN